MFENIRILLICDDEGIAKYLKQQLIVEGGYSVFSEASAEKGLQALKEDNFDVIIARSGMPAKDIKTLLSEIKKINPDSAIVVFADEPDKELQEDLSRLGAYEFIFRETGLEKLLFIITKGAELHSLMTTNNRLIQGLKEHSSAIEKQNVVLAKRIEESTKNLTRLYEDLRLTYMRTIKVLAQAIDARDHYTHSHSENVARFAAAIALEMGLSARDIEIIREACELHDLGKIGIQDSILTKPSSLNPEEWEQIKKHPATGAKILEPLTFLSNVIDLIKQHHEHFDGTGYPEGRKGEDILLGARIIHLADAYEAMTTPRSYRKIPLSKEEAIQEIKKHNGAQFDPKIVEAFLKVVDKL